MTDQVMTTEIKENQDTAVAACRLVRESVVQTLESVWHAGKALQAVKDDLDHGMFTDWVEGNCGVTHRRANHWIEVAKHYTLDEMREAAMLGRSLNGMLKQIRVEREPAVRKPRVLPPPPEVVDVKPVDPEPARKVEPTPAAEVDTDLQKQLNEARERAQDAEERAAIVDDPATEERVKDLQAKLKRFETERNDAVKANKHLRRRLANLRRDIAKGVPHDQLLADHWNMEKAK